MTFLQTIALWIIAGYLFLSAVKFLIRSAKDTGFGNWKTNALWALQWPIRFITE